MKVQITDEVMDVLKQASISGNNLTLSGQLDRKLYVQVDAILKLCGGKWNRGAKAHVFDEDPGDVIEAAITTGEVLDRKKAFQFFPTPVGPIKRKLAIGTISNHSKVRLQ